MPAFFSDAAQDQSFLPLLSGITQDTAFLPVPPGYKYMFVASAVDHVGNRQSLDLNKAITVDFELQKRKFVCKKVIEKITKYDFILKITKGYEVRATTMKN